jgi:hypothetical protein
MHEMVDQPAQLRPRCAVATGVLEASPIPTPSPGSIVTASAQDRAVFVVPGPRAPPDIDLFIVEPTLPLCAVTGRRLAASPMYWKDTSEPCSPSTPKRRAIFVLGNFTAPGAVTLARVQ